MMSSSYPVKAPKKLIEVALPLDDINEQAAREKSIRHGHPSTLHLWWARRPLAAARAVIFAQLVNDPSWKWEMEHPGEVPPSQLKASWASSRKRLFGLISELAKWENTTNSDLLAKARAEIHKSWREVCEVNRGHPQAATRFNPSRMPGLHDPFAGGGTIPLEAQRLGLEVVASDLNPVAVLINKAMVEIPPRFAAQLPVHPEVREQAKLQTWANAQGLAEDVRRYGAWMRAEAEKKLGHLYPRVLVSRELAAEQPMLTGHVGQELTVIAWLWARTVKSPNPAFSHVDVPLVASFVLSNRKGKAVWLEPEVSGDRFRLHVRRGTSPPRGASDGTKVARGSFRCICSGTPIPYTYIDDEANEGRMGVTLLAMVVDVPRLGRVYLDAISSHLKTALEAVPAWFPETPCRGTWGSNAQGRRYGFKSFADYFTQRQLVLLSTLAELATAAGEACHRAAEESLTARQDALDAEAYGNAISLYLALGIDKVADYNSSLVVWSPTRDQAKTTFSRQAISMTWDFAEVNPFAGAAGDLQVSLAGMVRSIYAPDDAPMGTAFQADAQAQVDIDGRIVSTDPPYYGNVAYSDLSDFFYVWLRRSLRPIYPSLFAGMAVPKEEELVATPHRDRSRVEAEEFFLEGMTQVMRRLHASSAPGYPITIYYAFKESDTQNDGDTSSTGWETFLDAVLRAGFAITGTWPMRTERLARSVGIGTNSLASSVVLVCRPRPPTALTVSRREFLRELNTVLPIALDEMTRGAGDDRSPVAPVDLSQAIIGPGMAVFSKYAAVLEADGTPMTVKTALQLINRFLAEDDFDADTQFCLHWFEQHGWSDGAYGDADVLARAKATSVGGIEGAGVLISGGGKVRLRRPAEYPAAWDPRTDKRLPVWEVLHQLIRAFRAEGETGAGQILGAVKHRAEAVRQLAYRLYTLCERRGWAEDARAYNDLVISWTAVETIANTAPEPAAQLNLFGGS